MRRLVGKLLAVALLAPLLAIGAAGGASAQLAQGAVVNEVSPGPQVAVGEAVTFTATLYVGGEVPMIPNFASGSVPDAFQIVSVSSPVGDCGFTGQQVSCSNMLYGGMSGGLQQVVVELVPLHRAYDQALSIGWSDEWGGFGGPPAIVDVIDPTVTADVHAEASGPDLAVVGEPFAVTGTIISSGSVGVADVVATVSADPSLQLTSVAWGNPVVSGQPSNPCALSAGAATCAVGALGPWTAVPFRVDVTPLVADPDAGVTVTVTTTSTVDAPDPYPDTTVHPVEVIDPVTDVAVWFSPWAEEYVLGEGDGFVVYAENRGPARALGTEVVVEVPADLAISTASLRSWGRPPNATGCTVVGQVVTCGVGDLAAGQAFPVSVSVVPQTLDGGQLQASVSSAVPELAPDPSPNTATKPYTVIEPWLSSWIELQGPSTGLVGQPLELLARPAVSGPLAPVDATVVVDVPAGWEVLEARENHTDSDCAVVGPQVTCELPQLAERSTPQTVFLTVVPDATGPATVTAAITTPYPDDTPENDVDVLEIEVSDPIADLSTGISQMFVHYVGQDGHYDVRVTNSGTAVAEDVVVTAPVPPSATLVSVAPTGVTGSCEVVEGLPTCTLATLAPGSTFVVRMTVHHSGDLMQVPVEASASTASPEPVPDPHPNQATRTIELQHTADLVSGTVRGPGGVPLAGATVNFFPPGAFLPAHSVTTSSGGTFSRTFDTTDVRTYAVQIVPPAETGFATEWWEDSATRSGATTLSLGRQSRDVVLDVRVGPDVGLPSAVSGTVAIDGGVAGTTVTAHLVGDPTPTATTTVGTDGSFAFAALPAGSYLLAFHPPPGVDRPVVWSTGNVGFVPTWSSFVVYGTGAPVVVPHQVVMPHVTGTIRDRSGAPVVNAEVRLFLPGEFLPARVAWTDASGAFLAGGVPSGDYQVLVVPPSGSGLGQRWWVDAPTRPTAATIPLPAGGVWPRVEIELPYANPVPSDVSGSVSVDEGPVEGGLVVAYELSDEWEPTAMTTVGADGSFAFEDLPIGTYSLAFGAPAGVSRPVVWSGGVYDRWQGTTFSVFGSGAPIALGNQELVSWGSLGGTVTDGSGAPMANVEVLAFRPGQAWVPQYTAVTAADGSWSLPEVLPDRYQVLFQAPVGSGLPQRWFDGTALRVSSTWVQVGSNAEVGGVDAAMAAWATVSGTVTGPGGVPVAGVRVAAYAPSDAFVGSREVFTDAEGRYVMRWVDPGTYKLRFLPPAGSGLAGEWFDDVATRSAATGVVMAEGSQLTNRDATLAPAP